MYVITGASDGLGLALATLLAAKGDKVVSLSRSKPKLDGAHHIVCDLTNEGSINVAAEAVLALPDKLTALVHCAGIYKEEELEDLSGQTLAPMFTTNIIGPEILTARLFERIKKDEADVLCVGSKMATRGDPWAPGYTSSKWALRGFTEVLRTKLADTACRVTMFNPGGMDTAIFKKAGSDTNSAAFMNPNDIARLMLTILQLPKNIEVGDILVNNK